MVPALELRSMPFDCARSLRLHPALTVQAGQNALRLQHAICEASGLALPFIELAACTERIVWLMAGAPAPDAGMTSPVRVNTHELVLPFASVTVVLYGEFVLVGTICRANLKPKGATVCVLCASAACSRWNASCRACRS